MQHFAMSVLIGVLLSCAMGSAVADESVVTYHNAADRSGLYIDPALTWANAPNVKLDAAFHAGVDGWVYAQPLYWLPAGKAGQLIVATEQNFVYALDAASGEQIWKTSLGPPVPRKDLPCGNIDPIGVTGTPVIDLATGLVYLEAFVETTANGPRHYVFGLSLTTGAIAPGWPVDIGAGLATLHRGFDETPQGQRSALALINGNLYVPYAGHYGDCGVYNGMVVGLNVAKHAVFGAWSTKTQGGGSWGQSGVAFDGASLYVTTGNAFGASTVWGGSEAVVKLPLTLADPTGYSADYFAPVDWHTLDERDLDLGGTSAIPVWTPTTERVLALGKDGNAYLLNPENLGGVGYPIETLHVSTGEIRTAMATFPAYPIDNAGMVVYGAGGGGKGAACPSRQSGDLVMLKVTPSAVTTAWCVAAGGASAPIVTTTDGKANPIVWVAGSKGIFGYRGTDGKLLVHAAGGGTLLGTAMLFANGRFYTASFGVVSAFTD